MSTLRHLSWAGRVAVVGYALRRLFVAPAPADERCFMGAPVADAVWCPRRAVVDGVWCSRHEVAS